MMGITVRVPAHKTLHQRIAMLGGECRWHLEPGSHLYLIHEQSCDEINSDLTFDLGAGSTLIYVPIIMQSGAIRLSLNLAEYASVQVQGAYAFNGTQKSSIITRQQHAGPHSTSALRISGIAAGFSRIEYTGMIVIQESAHRSSAQQENKTLLLSNAASALSIPSLEVLTNDVQCGHGSAVGPLQKEQLWYAQSRGICLQDAQRLLISSYFAQILAAILDETVRHEIVARLVSKALGE
jgi:Fe-S cluster assembly protein SufD